MKRFYVKRFTLTDSVGFTSSFHLCVGYVTIRISLATDETVLRYTFYVYSQSVLRPVSTSL